MATKLLNTRHVMHKNRSFYEPSKFIKKTVLVEFLLTSEKFSISAKPLSNPLQDFIYSVYFHSQEKGKESIWLWRDFETKPASRILKSFFFCKVWWMHNIDFVVSEISHIKPTWKWSVADKFWSCLFCSWCY